MIKPECILVYHFNSMANIDSDKRLKLWVDGSDFCKKYKLTGSEITGCIDMALYKSKKKSQLTNFNIMKLYTYPNGGVIKKLAAKKTVDRKTITRYKNKFLANFEEQLNFYMEMIK